jgi:hypothetical protein
LRKKIYIRDLEKVGVNYFSGLGISTVLYKHKLWLEGNKKGEKAEINDMTISRADLSFFNLSKAKIFAFFEDVYFSHTIFDNALFSRAKFVRCTFDSVSFKKATLKNVEFEDCDFFNTTFERATIEHSGFGIRRHLIIDFNKAKFTESFLINFYGYQVIHTDLKTFFYLLFSFNFNKYFFERDFIFDVNLPKKEEGDEKNSC